MKKKITLILFLVITLLFSNIKVKADDNNNLVNIYFFHSNTCSHCKEENILLEELEERYDNIKIYKYEIHDENTQEILQKANTIYGLKTNGVPLTIIGNKVYTGFSSEKSSLKFIKTIEYYSRYGYIDELGAYLELELPTYNINDEDITLELFMNSYCNYNLLGLETDNLDSSSIAIILGILSSINITNIISIILIAVVLIQIKTFRNKIIFIGTYIFIKIALLLTNLVNNSILTIIIYLILLIAFLFAISKVIKKKKNYIYFCMILIILIITNQITLNIDKNLIIFKNILKLHNLKGLSKISYYSNYIVITLIMNAFIIWGIYTLIKYSRNIINSKIKTNLSKKVKRI